MAMTLLLFCYMIITEELEYLVLKGGVGGRHVRQDTYAFKRIRNSTQAASCYQDLCGWHMLSFAVFAAEL